VDYGERQVELSCAHGQAMQYHNKVPFEQVDEIDVIFEVHRHVIVPCNYEIKNHRCDASE